MQNKKWQFALEFIAEIGGAALLGGIFATICLHGNPCSRFRCRQSRQGSLLQLRLLVGVHIDASMAAWARNNVSNCNTYLFVHLHTRFRAFFCFIDLGWCTTCCHSGCLRPCWKPGMAVWIQKRLDTKILPSNSHKTIQQTWKLLKHYLHAEIRCVRNLQLNTEICKKRKSNQK